MAPEKSPAFQFYVKDFLTDANVAGMSLQERGAYITLLCLCWQEGSLPGDSLRLAHMVGMNNRQWAGIEPAIRACFREVDGRIVHPRLEIERQKQAEYRAKQSAKGKASAASRNLTTVQPGFNRGSTGGSTERQPEGNSPISDLQTTSKKEVLQASFARFWARYPKHTDEQEARETWELIAPNEEFAEKICAAAAAYAEHVRDTDPHYIKSPKNWLSKACWQDELRTLPASKSGTGGSLCPHTPRCARSQECVAKTIAEARAARAGKERGS